MNETVHPPTTHSRFIPVIFSRPGKREICFGEIMEMSRLEYCDKPNTYRLI